MRKEGRTYKEAKHACGSLGVLDCNTRQFFSRMCKRRGVSREEEAQEGATTESTMEYARTGKDVKPGFSQSPGEMAWRLIRIRENSKLQVLSLRSFKFID